MKYSDNSGERLASGSKPLANGFRVLLIDDDPVFAFSVKALFKLMAPEVEVYFANNGLDGVDAIRQFREDETPIHLTLLDLNMPVMDGWEFLEKVESLEWKKELPIVIVLTSSIDKKEHDRALNHERVYDLYEKPLDKAKMASILHLLKQEVALKQ